MESLETPSFQDITGPEAFLPEAPLPMGWLVTGLFALIAIGVLLFRIIKKVKKTHSPTLSPKEQALLHLSQKETLSTEATSLIFREYLSQVTESAALYQTYEEISDANHFPRLGENLQSEIKTLLQQFSQHAYQNKSSEPSPFIEETKGLIEKIELYLQEL